MPNNAELLQAQQSLVQHTMKICLNVSCSSLSFSYNKTVTFLKFAKLYRMLIRHIVFIYIYTRRRGNDLFARFTLPAVTLRRTEDFIFVN